MGRGHRVDVGGQIYHVLNRANDRRELFAQPADYRAFEATLAEAKKRCDMRLLAYCIMPNHWHLVLYPRADGHLSRFVGWLTLAHTQRWHAWHGTTGSGHLYQGRYKSFLCADDDHFLTVARYVERNPKRANLVERAETWRWSSAWRRCNGSVEDKKLLDEWPIPIPGNYPSFLNEPQTAAELEAVRNAVQRDSPFGSSAWAGVMTAKFGLEATLRPRGRPKSGSSAPPSAKGS